MKNNENTHQHFLIKMQLEYLTHKLRSLIYQEKRFAKVAQEIAEKKRKKIIDLGNKYNLKTIFDESVNVDKFVKEYFLCPYGLPKFQYKDKEQERIQGNYDKWYLFYRGNQVIFNGKKAEILSNDPSTNTVKIRTNKEVLITDYINITLKLDFVWI